MPNNQNLLRAAIVGTGYIADFHARAIRALKGVELAAVCDSNLSRASAFAAAWGLPKESAFDTIDSMLSTRRPNAIHILVPPDRHFDVAKVALDFEAHVFIEKPACASAQEVDELLAQAEQKRLRLAVNHNMLFAGAYQRLRKTVLSGELGPIDHISITHFLELGQIRFGPFDSWMVRAPANTILEIGPHPFSALIDLIGSPDTLRVTADRELSLPGGSQVFRRWHIRANIGRTTANVDINLGPGFHQRTISIRGLSGSAVLDFDANTCTVDRRSAFGIDFDRYSRSRSLARQTRWQARETLADYILSKLKLRTRGNPYEISFLDSVATFYAGLNDQSVSLDNRISGQLGRDVVDLCARVVQSADIKLKRAPKKIKKALKSAPIVLVLGGTGFIGREVVRQLLAANYSVRALVRGSSAVLDEYQNGNLDIVRGDMSSEKDLKRAMSGIDFVYHLALGAAKTWEEHMQRDFAPTRLVAEACLAAGVKRFIYTGTIDSYYAGARAGVITEKTPLDPSIASRNYYARSKALAEKLLMEMHETKKLPVIIFRPGIVIGPGGNPFHWGVGQWLSESVCEVWGDGQNKLPFILVTDVAQALVRGIQLDGIEGRSYNLVDTPLLTARDYLKEVQRRTGLFIRVDYRPIWRFYSADVSKWLVKLATGHPDRVRIPSYFDWESRTQKAVFDCTRARNELGWTPASNPQRMLDEGIGGSLRSWLATSQ